MTKDICAFTLLVKRHVTAPAGLKGIMFKAQIPASFAMSEP